MLSLRRSLILCVAIAATLVPAAPAPAATTAQRFADAVERGKSAMRGKKAEIEAAYDASNLEECSAAFEREPPERAVDTMAALFVIGLVQPVVEPSKPVYDQIVADLTAIPTNDPILRSGRAVWRAYRAQLDQIALIQDPCGQLARWARTGWRRSATPKIDVEAIDRLIESKPLEAKMRRAVRRLRQLGVSRADAERFRGETMYDDVLSEDIFEVAFGESDEPL